jgi:hypothetical protein
MYSCTLDNGTRKARYELVFLCPQVQQCKVSSSRYKLDTSARLPGYVSVSVKELCQVLPLGDFLGESFFTMLISTFAMVNKEKAYLILKTCPTT